MGVGARQNVRFHTNPADSPFDYAQGNTSMNFTQGATTNAGADPGYDVDDHSIVLPSIICADPRVGRPGFR